MGKIVKKYCQECRKQTEHIKTKLRFSRFYECKNCGHKEAGHTS